MQSIFTFTLHLFTGELPAAAAVDVYKVNQPLGSPGVARCPFKEGQAEAQQFGEKGITDFRPSA